MNPADWIVIIVVAGLLALAVYNWKKQGCHSDCASCHAGCKKPTFVEAYRRDHPKSCPACENKDQNRSKS